MTSGAHTSGNEENPVTEVISIKFRGRGKTYYFDPAGVTARTGDTLVVETSKGMELGECVKGNHMVGDGDCVQPLRPVVRRATPDDLRIAELNRKREKEALGICRELIEKHKLEMKLVDVECSFEGNKILFFFTADGRVDFRELVKDLAGVFRTRIELRQIGVRDEAKMLGGLGICGRPFCCHQFLDDFQPVSTKMAKTQSMSLNPVKISGTCGRLMCCLRYEQEAYEDLLKHVPKNGAFVQTEDGYGSVTLVNLLRQNVKVKLDGGRSADPHLRCRRDRRDPRRPPGGGPAPARPSPQQAQKGQGRERRAGDERLDHAVDDRGGRVHRVRRAAERGEALRREEKQPLPPPEARRRECRTVRAHRKSRASGTRRKTRTLRARGKEAGAQREKARRGKPQRAPRR